jgi:CheY-like chemotaxis protein
VTRQVLERYGYAVLEAPDGVTGLRIAERHQGKIDLLLTDIMMPRMSGREVARLLRVQRPETRVMYVSGYTDEASNNHELHPGEVHLQKPFTPDALARTVREALRKEPPAA